MEKYIGLNPNTKNRKANVLVIGGNGTGKTVEYIKPTILSESDEAIECGFFTERPLTEQEKQERAECWKEDTKALESYPYGMKQKGDKWVLIPTPLELEMSKVLKEKMSELSEDAAVILAHDFLSDSYNYDYFYHRKREGENACMEAFDLKSDYGAEPFIFDENSKPVSINEPVFSQWIDDVLKNMRYRLILPCEYADELADGTLTVEKDERG